MSEESEGKDEAAVEIEVSLEEAEKLGLDDPGAVAESIAGSAEAVNDALDAADAKAGPPSDAPAAPKAQPPECAGCGADAVARLKIVEPWLDSPVCAKCLAEANDLSAARGQVLEFERID